MTLSAWRVSCKSCENLSTPHHMLTGRNRSLTSLTRSLSSSSRTNASGFISSLTHRTSSTSHLGYVSLLWSFSGSLNIHPKSYGIPARSSGGVRLASRIVSPMFPHLQSEPPAFKSTPPLWRAPNPRKAPRSHLTTWRSRMCTSKQAATKLPPHRSWDYAIDLLFGFRPLKGRV